MNPSADVDDLIWRHTALERHGLAHRASAGTFKSTFRSMKDTIGAKQITAKPADAAAHT